LKHGNEPPPRPQAIVSSDRVSSSVHDDLTGAGRARK